MLVKFRTAVARLLMYPLLSIAQPQGGEGLDRALVGLGSVRLDRHHVNLARARSHVGLQTWRVS